MLFLFDSCFSGLLIRLAGHDRLAPDPDRARLGIKSGRQDQTAFDGPHAVAIGDLADDCMVEDNPRVVPLSPGGSGSTTFEVTCGPLGAPLVIDVTTTGTDVDTDGYRVTVDGADVPIDPTGSVTVEDVTVGEHWVTLTGLSPNCSVAGENPQTVTVTAEGTSRTSFSVVCQGSIVVSTTTTGTPVDPDGYTISVEGIGGTTPVPTNGEATIEGLPDGDQVMTLGDIAANCSVEGENPRTVTVLADGTGQVVFRVRCEPPGS